MIEFLRNIYVANASNIVLQSTALMKWSTRLLLVTKLITGVIVAAGLLAYAIPVLVYVLTGQLIPIAPLYIPFLNENTTAGFTALILIQTVWDAQVIVGMVAADTLLTLFILFQFLMGDLFDNLFLELNCALDDNPHIARSGEVYACVRNLTMMHQQMCK